jgi:hypothetical protein
MNKKKRGRPVLPDQLRRAPVTIRLDPKIRAGLIRESKRRKRTLSSEIEARLQESLRDPDTKEKAFGKSPDRDLAFLIVKLAQHVRAATGKSWRKDRFSFEAFRVAIQILLANLAPPDDPEVPQMIREIVRIASQEGWPDPNQLLSPHGVGQSVGLGLWRDLMLYDPPAYNEPVTHPIFKEMPHARVGLGLEKDEAK